MILLSGNHGFLFSGYQVAAVLGTWSLKREDGPVGNQKAFLSAIFMKIDRYWIGQEATRMALKLGSHYWVWESPIVKLGMMTAEIEVLGDPKAIEQQVISRSAGAWDLTGSSQRRQFESSLRAGTGLKSGKT